MKSLTLIIGLMLMVPHVYASYLLQTMSRGNGNDTTVVMLMEKNPRFEGFDLTHNLVYRPGMNQHRELVQLHSGPAEYSSPHCVWVAGAAFSAPAVVIDGVMYDKESDRCKKTEKDYIFKSANGTIRMKGTHFHAISLRGSGFRTDRPSTIYVVEKSNTYPNGNRMFR